MPERIRMSLYLLQIMAHRPRGLVRVPRRVRCRTLRLDGDQRRVHGHVILHEDSPMASGLSCSPREQTTPSSSTPLTESRAILGTVHPRSAEGQLGWQGAEHKRSAATSTGPAVTQHRGADPSRSPSHAPLLVGTSGPQKFRRSTQRRPWRQGDVSRALGGPSAFSCRASDPTCRRYRLCPSPPSLSPGPDPRCAHCSNVRFTVPRNPAATL